MKKRLVSLFLVVVLLTPTAVATALPRDRDFSDHPVLKRIAKILKRFVPPSLQPNDDLPTPPRP